MTAGGEGIATARVLVRHSLLHRTNTNTDKQSVHTIQVYNAAPHQKLQSITMGIFANFVLMVWCFFLGGSLFSVFVGLSLLFRSFSSSGFLFECCAWEWNINKAGFVSLVPATVWWDVWMDRVSQFGGGCIVTELLRLALFKNNIWIEIVRPLEQSNIQENAKKILNIKPLSWQLTLKSQRI